MKQIWVFALFIPLLSFGQKFEVSEICGNSFNKNAFNAKVWGFSNQLSVNYYFTKYLSIGAYHQLDVWKPYHNSVGLMADAHYKFLDFGVNVAELYTSAENFPLSPPDLWAGTPSNNYPHSVTIKINPTTSCGFHFGVHQQLTKRLFLKQQFGYTYSDSKSTVLGDNLSIKINCISAIAGIAYRL